MKLSAWARQNGIAYRTAWNWFRAGKLPVRATQMPSGTILVHEAVSPADGVALYARVSSQGQAPDLARQLSLLHAYAAERGLRVTQSVTEVGSGLDVLRPKLLKLLQDRRCGVILVENQSRLCPLDFARVAATLAENGQLVRVARPQGPAATNAALVGDMACLLQNVTARLRSRPSAVKTQVAALDEVQP